MLFITVAHLSAGPRDADWKKVDEARKKSQPKTVMELLRGIEEAAFTDEAWAEGTRAMAARIAEEVRIDNNRVMAVKTLDAEMEKVPEAARSVLRALSAWWLHRYYQSNRWKFMQRSLTAAPPGEDIASWDLTRILAVIDSRFQRALADGGVLKQIPVADYAELLVEGELGDVGRPTVYDFLAHTALEFYAMEETAASKPADAFEVP